ncbi:hypothetical protein V6N12_062321 [Hibiscus sabdariffa]|uniref:GDT1 family protein n=1 Tax=Hibiscus sabdariffa TaxID=183260 RepID=A0ABR2F8H2_9ROSI
MFSRISQYEIGVVLLFPKYRVQCGKISRLSSTCSAFRTRASNVGFGSGGYEEREEKRIIKVLQRAWGATVHQKRKAKPSSQIPYPLSIAFVLLGCTLVLSLIAFAKGGPASLLAAIAKSGFTAAFTLIFVSEIGDKQSEEEGNKDIGWEEEGITTPFPERVCL